MPGSAERQTVDDLQVASKESAGGHGVHRPGAQEYKNTISPDLPLEEFVAAMYRARETTRGATAQIRSETVGQGSSGAPVKNRIPYWFACLEDELGLED